MVVALGFWALALGYATIYTGVQGFVTGSGSLAANLGLHSLTVPSNVTQSATTSASASNLSDVAAAGTSAAATAGAASVIY